MFCFLKGEAALSRLAASMPVANGNAGAGTPVDIRWWSHLEKNYGRPSTAREGTVGMFHNTSYDEIGRRAADPANGVSREGHYTGVPCSCTD